MSRSTPVFIGLRYISSKRSNGFLSFVSVFATGGMALGVFALVLVLSVMNGFDHELKERILRAVPHGFVSDPRGLADWPVLAKDLEKTDDLLAASPYVGGNVLVSLGSAVKGVELQGILPEYDAAVSPVAQYFVRGSMDTLKEGEFGIVLGSLLAYSIGAQIGDRVVVTLPKVSITLAGVFPRSRQFRVVGLFEAGAQVDQSLALIHMGDAQKLFRKGEAVDGLRVKFSDMYLAPAGMQKIKAHYGEQYEVIDWSQTQGSLFQAVKLEKTVTGLLLGIIIAVAAFNIITSLIMMVTEKKSDIAVLRTMGMTRSNIMQIFIVQGLATSFLGIGFGLVLGVPAAMYLSEIIAFFEQVLGLTVFDPAVYFVTSIPSLWLLSDTLIICGFAVLSSLLATLYPAYRASLIEPADAMRYDS